MKSLILWTLAFVALVGTCLVLVFQCLAVAQRPEVSDEQVRMALEHMANNFPVWRLSRGFPSDQYLCATNLNFSTTFVLSAEEVAQARVDQTYPQLFFRMIARTNGSSKIESWLQNHRGVKHD